MKLGNLNSNSTVLELIPTAEPQKVNMPTPESIRRREATLEKLQANLSYEGSDENTAISMSLADASINSNEFLDTLSAFGESPMYKFVRSAVEMGPGANKDPLFDLDLFAARMYLAGRFDQRGAPIPESESARLMQ